MTSFGAALSSLTQEAYKPRLTDFGGGKNAKSLYGLSPRCNDLCLAGLLIEQGRLLATRHRFLGYRALLHIIARG